MTIVRVQHAFAHSNGLGRDQFVNTFYFRKATVSDADMDALDGIVKAFWVGDPPTSALPVVNYFSGIADGATGSVKMYFMEDSTPRPVRHTSTTGLPTFGSAAGNMPSEVAVCLSYEGTALGPGVPVRRRRGRVYIGPLGNNANASTDANTEATVVTGLQNSLTQAAYQMKTDATTAGFIWSVYSHANSEAYEVTKAWVDNAFDIQRRRGIRPSSRTTITLS